MCWQDEIDAIATKRFDAQTGADREVQRILLELLNQMDGFDQTVNVKVIMATNRHDTLDPALLRPGRLDRKIEFPNPDRRQKRLIFQVCTSKMNLSEEIDLEDYVQRPEKLSAADISAIAQEAGLHAVRNNRYVILNKDFEKAYKSAHHHTPSHKHTHTHSNSASSTSALELSDDVGWLRVLVLTFLPVCGLCTAGTTSRGQTRSTNSTPRAEGRTALVSSFGRASETLLRRLIQRQSLQSLA